MNSKNPMNSMSDDDTTETAGPPNAGRAITTGGPGHGTAARTARPRARRSASRRWLGAVAMTGLGLGGALAGASCSSNDVSTAEVVATTSTTTASGLGSAAADANRGAPVPGSGADAKSGAADPGGGSSTATSGGGSPTDTSGFCAIFTSLEPSGKGEAKGGATTPESWAKRLDTVQRAAALAPAEIKPQAETYVQMIKDRAALAAQFDYAAIPSDAMQTFIGSHRDMQQQVNQLLGFVRTTCGGIGAAETGGSAAG